MRNARFIECYNQYYSFVCGVLYVQVRDEHVAEDLAQEIFIALYRKMDTIHKEHNWLMGAIRFELREYYRRSDQLPSSLDVIFNEDNQPAGPDHCSEMKLIIREAIEAITGFIERVVFDLVSIQQYTYIDAAAALGLSKRQVRYRHGLAVRQVINTLSAKGINSVEDLL